MRARSPVSQCVWLKFHTEAVGPPAAPVLPVSPMFGLFKKIASGFDGERLVFEDTGITVNTTQLLAEGGYSYVYAAKEVSGPRQFAAKKVLAQDAETRQVAEVETRVLQQLSGQTGFVQVYGAMSRPAPVGRNSREYWMLLEFCSGGSLVDLLYKKGKGGAYEKREPMPLPRILEIFEEVVAAIAHMHALSPPVTHRDLKLENVLGTADGRFVLCDFGSAVTTKLPAERTRKQAAIEEEVSAASNARRWPLQSAQVLHGCCHCAAAAAAAHTHPARAPPCKGPASRDARLADRPARLLAIRHSAFTSTRRSCTARPRWWISIVIRRWVNGWMSGRSVAFSSLSATSTIRLGRSRRYRSSTRRTRSRRRLPVRHGYSD